MPPVAAMNLNNTDINGYPCSGNHFSKKYAFNIVPVP
jgi:hypothetical protein